MTYYAGVCVGGPWNKQGYSDTKTTVTLMSGPARASMNPTTQVIVKELGTYVWDADGKVWNWKPVFNRHYAEARARDLGLD